MELKLTNQEAEQMFYDALCNGLDYIAGYGLEIDYDDEQYRKSRNKLKATSEHSICFEDTLLQILRDGGELSLIDTEYGEDEKYTITLSDVHDRMAKVPLSVILEVVQEQDDASTADQILQTIFLNEIIFG